MTLQHINKGLNSLAAKTVKGHQLAATRNIMEILNQIYQEKPELYPRLQMLKDQIDVLNMVINETRKMTEQIQELYTQLHEEFVLTNAQYEDLLTALIVRDRNNQQVQMFINDLQTDRVLDFGYDEDYTEYMLNQMAAYMSQSYGHGETTCYRLLYALVHPQSPRDPFVEEMLESLYEMRRGA